MSNQKDGGPAFPRTGYYPPEVQGMEAWRERSHTETDPTQGMTLRDYFATAALQGMLCNGFMPDQARQSSDETYNYALAAFALSNAMLEARNQ